jgi:acetyl-CoA hydrolase
MAELAMGEEGDPVINEKIAQFIAERIPDGATLQTGIGAIPDAVLKHLKHKKNLGIHSELFSDGVLALVETGVINGALKTINNGKITAGFIIGTRKLYEWVNDNPLVELHRTEYVNNPFVIAQNRCMVAINSAIEVDLTGQVCADSIGPKFYSGVGGQMDFIYGSSLSEGGLPIIALPSFTTLRDEMKISRIVPMLKPGAGVDTTRSHVHYVVTEYGMVDLYGKTIRQRCKELISIAHTQFREELTAKAKELNYL